jgi:multidrug efflux system membrane fusion protein
VELSTFGTVQADATVAVKSQVDGIITKVHFTKGQHVRKGDLLFTVDPRPFKAALDQAEANLARDTVLANNAQKDVQRAEALYQKGIASEEELDKAKASAESQAAAVRADAALVERARLDLEYCSIASPIDGRIGNMLVDEGNLITKANDAALAVVNRIRPVQVFFSLPQTDLGEVRKYMAQSPLTVLAYAEKDQQDAESGKLVFVDNAIDTGTGTVRLGAVFANEDERLWPGQYVAVKLTLATRHDAIVVPSKAVETGRDGKYVFVIRADKRVEFRPVTVLANTGDVAVIGEGLRVGEQVVTDGQFRLSPGWRVEIKSDKQGAAAATGASPATSRAAS